MNNALRPGVTHLRLAEVLTCGQLSGEDAC